MLRRSLTPPLAGEHVEEAIGLVAHDFMKMTAEQKQFLRRVASGDGTVNPAESEVQLMARLLQSHLLLGAQAPDVAELVARTRDQARPQVKQVATLTLTEPAGESAVLAALLAPHPAALLLVCPAGSLPLVRDAAPDLWSVRSLTATLDRAADIAVTAPDRPEIPASGGDFMPVPGEPIQPSPEVGALLKRAAAGLQAGRLDLALDGGLSALDARSARTTSCWRMPGWPRSGPSRTSRSRPPGTPGSRWRAGDHSSWTPR